MNKHFLLTSILAAAVVGIFGIQPLRASNPGDLDTTFGTGGITLTDVNGTNDGANGLVIQSDGKIVTGGRGTGGTLIRYNANGSLDTTFGTGGFATQMLAPYATEIIDVGLQSDGKIVFAGSQNDASGNHFFVVGRALPNGALDTSFGTDGFARTAFGTGGVATKSLIIHPDGKIVVAGYAFLTNGVPAVFAVARYDAAGNLDAGFGAGGKVTTAFDDSSEFGDQPQAVALAPDGKIVVGGTHFSPTTFRDFQAARYNTDGSLDESFGVGGKVVLNVMNNDLCQALAVQPDGKVLLGGSSNNFVTFTVVRYSVNGTLDPSFGTGGIKLGPPLVSESFMTSLAVQPDGKILAAGSSNQFPNRDVTLVRYNIDGSVDSTFGNSGVVITPIGINRLDGPTEIKLQADGKIVVTGSSEGDTFVLRYLNDLVLTPPMTISVSGRVTTPDGRGLRNVVVALTDSQGVRRMATTSSFGLYSFDNVTAGDTYIISAASKRYRFTPVMMAVNGNLTGVDFVGLE